MTKYLYQAVSGAGVFGEPKLTLREAKLAVASLRVGSGYFGAFPDAEVERILLLNNNARRYWRWRKGQWSFHDHYDPSPGDLQKWNAA